MKNAMGDDLGPQQERLVEAYRTLEGVLREHRDELAPFEQRGAIQALAALWQVMNGLDVEVDPVEDLGA